MLKPKLIVRSEGYCIRLVDERSISGSNIFSGEIVKRFSPLTKIWHWLIPSFEIHLLGRVYESCRCLQRRYDAS